MFGFALGFVVVGFFPPVACNVARVGFLSGSEILTISLWKQLAGFSLPKVSISPSGSTSCSQLLSVKISTAATSVEHSKILLIQWRGRTEGNLGSIRHSC